MTEAIRNLVKRFPHFEDIIDALSSSGTGFDALCHEFSEVSESLGRLNARVDPADRARAMELNRRRAALETEMLELMEANIRV